MNKTLLTLLLSVFSLPILAQNSVWVNEQLQKMTLDEKIGQLFMVAAYSNKDENHYQKIDKLVKDQKIGGLIFFQGTAQKQAELTNRYQKLAQTPLLIAIDGEWGLAMRLKNTTRFPRQLALGAIKNDTLIYKMGVEIGKQCKRMGIHMNLAPVADVNNNLNNPVINDRSFGEDKYNVANKSIAYMEGMRSQNILACAKHFPGHGDTDKDSHKTLPIINHTAQRLNDIELYPFIRLIEANIGAVMTAHLSVPALDNSLLKSTDANSPTTPASVSNPIVNGLLKQQLGFKGLIITDALNMRGVSDFFAAGDLDLKAYLAGNDILLFPGDVPKAINKIKQAVENGFIAIEDLDNRVAKILSAKQFAGLNNYQPIALTNLDKDLNNIEAELLLNELYENAITLVKNNKNILPINNVANTNIACLTIGGKSTNTFKQTLSKYTQLSHFYIEKDAPQAKYDKMLEYLATYNHVIIDVHDMSRYASKNFGFNSKILNFLQCIEELSNTSLALFGSPYSLSKFDGFNTVVVAYEDNEITQSQTAQMIFGALPFKGKLPVSTSYYYNYADGVTTKTNGRLSYGLAESVGINSKAFYKIDSIANQAILIGAAPGCQILIAKKGKVIFEKAYGYHTSTKKRQVKTTDIYDIASITKIAATLPSLMQMHDEGKWSTQTALSNLLPLTQNSNKANLQIGDILTHQARLKSWIPFYTRENFQNIYKTEKSINCNIMVGNNMYMPNNYVDTLFSMILESDLRDKHGYRYSDLGYYLLFKAVENDKQQAFENFVESNFYKPLGMTLTSYKPINKYGLNNIVPSEKDTYFRNQLLHGHVHDMGAAMLGGVSGHAGLFSNANDLAKLMQLYLNDGFYAGKRYFKQGTVNFFASQYSPISRRGLGFDKPETDPDKTSPCSENTPVNVFGHTGFTGTCAWADPDNDLIYIFLSNRVYPTMNNKKLLRENIRTNIQEVIYETLNTYPVKTKTP